MHFTAAALVNRDKQILTKLTTHPTRKAVGRRKAGQTMRVKAMLKRMGLK